MDDIDALIHLLETDLGVDDGSPPPRPPSSAVPRYDLLASLGFLVSLQSRATGDDQRALSVLQSLVSASLGEEPPTSVQDYHRQISTDIAAIAPPAERLRAIFRQP